MSIHDAIPFTKMTGSGNDFIVIDNRAGRIDTADHGTFTRAVCRRGLGIGADGVILIDHPIEPGSHFRWTYLNADGSAGEMCGNGAMCGARFAVHGGIAPELCRFDTRVGVIEARVPAKGSSSQVEVRLETPTERVTTATIEVNGEPWSFDCLRVGVPHVVAWVEDADSPFDAAGFDAWGRAVRHHEAFGPEGTNVNLVSVVDRQTIRMRTWERGVEAETLACGTGAIASTLCAMHTGRTTAPTTIRVTSGEALTVRLDGPDHLWLQGSARFIARGTIDQEALR